MADDRHKRERPSSEEVEEFSCGVGPPPAKSRSRSQPLAPTAPKGTFGKTRISFHEGRSATFSRVLLSSGLVAPRPAPSQCKTIPGDWNDLGSGTDVRKNFESTLRGRLAVLDAGSEYPTTEDFGTAVVRTLESLGYEVEDRARNKTPKIDGPPSGQKSWSIEVNVVNFPERIVVDPEDFSQAELANEELEALAEPARRSASFNAALASDDGIFRRIVYVGTSAANQTDSHTVRTSADWLPTFMEKLDDQRVPERRADRGEHIEIRIYPSTDNTRTLQIFRRCDRRRSESVAITSGSEATHDDLFSLATTMRVRAEEDDLTWDEVLAIKEDWRQGRNNRVSIGKTESWSLKARDELGPNDSPMVRTIWRALASVSLPNNRNGGLFRYATDAQLHAAFHHLYKFVESDDVLGIETVRCCITGEVLLTLPKRGVIAQMRELVESAKHAISIDHRWQISFVADSDGLPTLSLSGPLNFSVTSRFWNMVKHRYGYSILALFVIAISSNALLAAQATGVVASSSALIRGMLRMANVARTIYKTHRVPCPLFDRFTMPLKRARHAIEADLRILALLQVQFAEALPSSVEMLDAIGVDEATFACAADEELSDMSKEYERRIGERLNLDLVPPVRPGSNLTREPASLLPTFLLVSRILDDELRSSFNLVFVKTGDGQNAIISLTPTSRTTAAEVVQVFLRFTGNALASLGFSGPNPEVACYANAICYVADYIIRKNGGPFTEPTPVFFFDPVTPAVPLLIPPDSKGAFAPSIASNDHPRHDHGFPSTELDDLRFSRWSPMKNSVRLTTWIGNCFDGSGDASTIARNRERVVASAALLASNASSGIATALSRFLDIRPKADEYFFSLIRQIEEVDAARPQAPATSMTIGGDHASSSSARATEVDGPPTPPIRSAKGKAVEAMARLPGLHMADSEDEGIAGLYDHA